MNLDEETFLSAFLDGELDAEQRLHVESALVADPRLSEHLRALTTVRHLVGGLPRLSLPRDVSAAVVAQLDRRGEMGRLRLVLDTATTFWSSRAAAIFSVAAALVAAATLGVIWSSPAPPVGRAGRNVVTQPPTRPSLRSPLPVEKAAAITDLPSSRAAGTPLQAAVNGGALLALDRDDLHYEQAHESIRKLLDSPRLRKVFIVTDVLGGGAVKQVGEILDKTPRHQSSYGRITVSQGIVIDPDNPGQATVFAVVMDDREQEQLHAKLRAAFQDTVKETEPRADVVTQLADIGQVAVLPGTPVAELRFSGDLTALRDDRAKKPLVSSELYHDTAPEVDPLHNPENRIGVRMADPAAASEKEGPTPEQERSGPHPSLRRHDEEPAASASAVAVAVAEARTGGAGPRTRGEVVRAGERIAERPARPGASVVLVWVTSPRQKGRGVR
jgi:hypothetical protein